MNPQDPYQQPYQAPQQPAPTAPVPSMPQASPFGAPPVQPPVAPAPLPPAPKTPSSKKWVILSFVFIFTTLLMAGVAVWAYMNYTELKNDSDSKTTDAVSLAVKNQKEVDADVYAKAEKDPNALFVGPDDYGRLSFKYPKTWGVYEIDDASKGGTYSSVFNPGVIPPVSKDQRYALRVIIQDKEYDAVVSTYESKVKNGDLKSSSVTVGEQNGTRLDGNFSDDIRGSAVIFKIRDKTVTIQTDAETFTEDFNALIKTITFNK